MYAYVQDFNPIQMSHIVKLQRGFSSIKRDNQCWIMVFRWFGLSNFDYVECKLDRKSTSGTCHLLGSSL